VSFALPPVTVIIAALVLVRFKAPVAAEPLMVVVAASRVPVIVKFCAPLRFKVAGRLPASAAMVLAEEPPLAMVIVS
jgi:hypothetical protein